MARSEGDTWMIGWRRTETTSWYERWVYSTAETYAVVRILRDEGHPWHVRWEGRDGSDNEELLPADMPLAEVQAMAIVMWRMS